jgi:hypothetical protein
MNTTTPHRTAGTVLSEHQTSQGLVRYRWWQGGISVELLRGEPPATLAVVSGTGAGPRPQPMTE